MVRRSHITPPRCNERLRNVPGSAAVSQMGAQVIVVIMLFCPTFHLCSLSIFWKYIIFYQLLFMKVRKWRGFNGGVGDLSWCWWHDWWYFAPRDVMVSFVIYLQRSEIFWYKFLNVCIVVPGIQAYNFTF